MVLFFMKCYFRTKQCLGQEPKYKKRAKKLFFADRLLPFQGVTPDSIIIHSAAHHSIARALSEQILISQK